MKQVFLSTTTEFKEIDTLEPGTWINLVNPTQNESLEIANAFDIDIADLRAPLDAEEMSRITIEDEYTLIIVDVPITEERNNKTYYVTIPLGIILTEDAIITTCLEKLPLLDIFIHRRLRNFYTFMKSRFIFQILYRNAEARIRTARVVHRVVARLRGALRIEPQAAALPCRAGKAAVGLPLRERVEHNVVGVLQKLAELALRVGRRVDMGLAAEFLMTEPCLVQTGGRCARQILPNQRVHGKHRERLLRQQDLRAGASGNVPQDGQILHQTVFIEQVAGRRKLSKFHISPPVPACR